MKELDRGRASVALSPEEQEAVERAMAALDAQPRREGAAARCYVSPRLQQVLVLNASYEPLNVTSVRRAHVLVFKGKAEVIESSTEPLHSATDTYPLAARDPARHLRPRAARGPAQDLAPGALRARRLALRLLRHDGGRLTLDHVVPRCRGGESVWENVVTACAPCNLRKGNRLLEEMRLTLHRCRGRPRRCSSSGSRRRRSPGLAAVPAAGLDGRGVGMAFTCAVCGETHAGETRDIRMSLPEPIFLLDDEERESRAWVGDDSAVLQDPGGSVLRPRPARAADRGRRRLLRLRHLDRGRPAGLRRSRRALARRRGLAERAVPGHARQRAQPLSATEGLPVRIQLRDVRLLPLVELDDGEHELVEAQQHGISSHRVHELAATVE